MNIKKIVQNTMVMYMRMFITIGISFFTTRIILEELGDVDFGIFNLIIGLVAMLSFLKGSMAISTQRFLSFYQGKKDLIKQRLVFLNSLFIHLVLALLIYMILEFSGIFFFESILKIPVNRLDESKYIFHLVSLAIFISIISLPFIGSINAHEDLGVIALIQIFEVLLKLVSALFISIITFDKLIYFGWSYLVINGVVFICYAFKCMSTYDECRFSKNLKIDKHTIKELTGFSVWNLVGAVTGLAKTQGMAILLNSFFGVVVNSSFAVASQVSNQMTFFSTNLLKSINPQIMKSEGQGNRKEMFQLAMKASKFSFFLLAIFAIPSMFLIDEILGLWLKKTPEDAGLFCIIILTAILLDQLTIGLSSANQAIGKIKDYMLITGMIKLLILPVGFILLKSGLSKYTVLVGYAFFEGLAGISRIIMLNKIGGLPIYDFLKNVIVKSIIPIGLSLLMIFTIQIVTSDFGLKIYLLPVYVLVVFAFTISLGLSNSEKMLIFNQISRLKQRFITTQT